MYSFFQNHCISAIFHRSLVQNVLVVDMTHCFIFFVDSLIGFMYIFVNILVVMPVIEEMNEDAGSSGANTGAGAGAGDSSSPQGSAMQRVMVSVVN